MSTQAILLARAEGPFASVRRVASKTLIPGTAVYRHLAGGVGMAVKHLRSLPRRLSPQQKGSRVQKAHELLAVLKSAKHDSLTNVITLDESFLHVHTEFE
jgi:hypothetical protein